MARQSIGDAVFPQKGVGVSRNTETEGYSTTPSEKPQEAHREDKIGVGVYLHNLAPITLSNKQVVKYPDIHTTSYVLDAMSNNTDVNASGHSGIGGYGGYEDKVSSSSFDIKEEEATSLVGFFDKDVVHLAPSHLEYDSTTKYPRRIL